MCELSWPCGSDAGHETGAKIRNGVVHVLSPVEKCSHGLCDLP